MKVINKHLAGCIIYDQDGKILLLHRNTPKCKQWEIPGGKVEPGEAIEDAAIREAKEELGVDIRIVGMLGSDIFAEAKETLNFSWFMAAIKSGSPKIMETDIFDDLRYFSIRELNHDLTELSANTKNFLKFSISKQNITP